MWSFCIEFRSVQRQVRRSLVAQSCLNTGVKHASGIRFLNGITGSRRQALAATACVVPNQETGHGHFDGFPVVSLPMMPPTFQAFEQELELLLSLLSLSIFFFL